MVSRQFLKVFLKNEIKVFYKTKIYMYCTLLNFVFVSKSNWKSACSIQVTELEDKPNVIIKFSHIVGRLV